MTIKSPLYAQLWKEYQTLNYWEKREKLNNIVNALGDKLESYEETLNIINTKEWVSEEYLDALYEIIMWTLSEDFEAQKAKNLETIQVRFQELVAKHEAEREKDIQEAESLLNDLDNIN